MVDAVSPAPLNGAVESTIVNVINGSLTPREGEPSIALVAHLIVTRSTFGVLLRGLGGYLRAAKRAVSSVLALRTGASALAGLLAILPGIALVGLATSADANIAPRHTLLSVADIIPGGGGVRRRPRFAGVRTGLFAVRPADAGASEGLRAAAKTA